MELPEKVITVTNNYILKVSLKTVQWFIHILLILLTNKQTKHRHRENITTSCFQWRWQQQLNKLWNIGTTVTYGLMKTIPLVMGGFRMKHELLSKRKKPYKWLKKQIGATMKQKLIQSWKYKAKWGRDFIVYLELLCIAISLQNQSVNLPGLGL